MRLTRGTNVEVLSRKKVPTGAWHSAVILSGNGHTYSVRYDSYDETTGEVVIERVPRKALRPYPPPVVGADNWVPGNLVEVFHDESWKTATVTEVMGDYNLSVKLLGASEEFRAPRSHLRIKQCFCKGKWVAVGRAQYNISSVEKNAKPTLKRRSPLSSSYIEQYAAAAKKIRVIEKEGSDRQASFPSPASEKVDAFFSPYEGESYMHSSFNVKRTKIAKLGTCRGYNTSLVESPIFVNTVSCASSVGSSSSFDDNLCNFSYGSITFRINKLEDCGDDAESSNEGRHEAEGCSVPANEEFEAAVERSELQAYRSVLETLYASGPLTWEDATKMMNLRHRFHISDDEHLGIIRNLISADT